jgi:hypothetical protein
MEAAYGAYLPRTQRSALDAGAASGIGLARRWVQCEQAAPMSSAHSRSGRHFCEPKNVQKLGHKRAKEARISTFSIRLARLLCRLTR